MLFLCCCNQSAVLLKVGYEYAVFVQDLSPRFFANFAHGKKLTILLQTKLSYHVVILPRVLTKVST